ncbi:hypothetical protein PR202_gb00915 [Eleusine coracana subsp. coracana]|uniref:Uncharacterized protein n=1 Tax=Eleusine coracana subsp. coracana TaxID=191504 RepID=A0AAV5DUX3_ELECO|nr:hypothetical protein PR202_gb00915 [Eleusine coracana subsp. coracana]
MGAWLFWKQRNACVFEANMPSMVKILRTFDEEHHLWCLAGARDLRRLGLRTV